MSYILGFDAGGTYTDAVIFDSDLKKVVSSGKSLTTSNNLAIGLNKALKKSLSNAPLIPIGKISLVSLSTTLATNAVVNSNGGRVGLILIGFSKSILDNLELKKSINQGFVKLIKGGHNADGKEINPLDTKAIKSIMNNELANVDSIAITSQFSVRNNDHEIKTRNLIREYYNIPITCSYELTSNLNGPKRALTCVLNASLTGIIEELIKDVSEMIKSNNMAAKLMVVKGDGSLINIEVARLKPVETIMSGPAAASIGGLWLSKVKKALVVDIGGTTTDISLVDSGAPSLSFDGAEISGWKTMVESLSIETLGLGGDSEVTIDNSNNTERLSIGPRRIVPLCILGKQHSGILNTMEKQLNFPSVSNTDGQFVWIPKKCLPPKWLRPIEKKLFEKFSDNHPFPVTEIAPNQALLGALNRLINSDLVKLSGFTPTDAAHVLFLFNDFNAQAANLGAHIFSKQKIISGELIAKNAKQLSELVHETLILKSTKAILNYIYKKEFKYIKGHLVQQNPLIENAIKENDRYLTTISVKINLPIISIGASAKTYYPKIASKLSTKIFIPNHYSVAGAVGAAVGLIRQEFKVLITKTEDDLFKIHGNVKLKSFKNLDDATNYAISKAKKGAYEKSFNAGAQNIKIDVKNHDKIISIGSNQTLFLERAIVATAKGSPFAKKNQKIV